MPAKRINGILLALLVVVDVAVTTIVDLLSAKKGALTSNDDENVLWKVEIYLLQRNILSVGTNYILKFIN